MGIIIKIKFIYKIKIHKKLILKQYYYNKNNNIINRMNNSLVIEYTPFYIKENVCIINKEWFDKQSFILQNDLMNNLINIANEFDEKNNINSIMIESFDIPHNFIDKDTSIYYAFLKIYKQQYIFDNFIHLFNEYIQTNICDTHNDCILYENTTNYKHYGKIYECLNCNNYYILPNCTIIYLDDIMLSALIALHIKANKHFSPNDLNLISLPLIDTINTILKIYEDEGAFVKTSLKSAKKNNMGIKIIPCMTINDVFTNLVSANTILQSLLFGCNLIIRRWIDIKQSNEFRVYVLDKKIKAICQQSLTEQINNKKDENHVIKTINEWFNKIFDKISYNDCVIDLVLNDSSIELIEINSGGPWSTAGSSLFTWKEIIETCDILFRYL